MDAPDAREAVAGAPSRVLAARPRHRSALDADQVPQWSPRWPRGCPSCSAAHVGLSLLLCLSRSRGTPRIPAAPGHLALSATFPPRPGHRDAGRAATPNLATSSFVRCSKISRLVFRTSLFGRKCVGARPFPVGPARLGSVLLPPVRTRGPSSRPPHQYESGTARPATESTLGGCVDGPIMPGGCPEQRGKSRSRPRRETQGCGIGLRFDGITNPNRIIRPDRDRSARTLGESLDECRRRVPQAEGSSRHPARLWSRLACRAGPLISGPRG